MEEPREWVKNFADKAGGIIEAEVEVDFGGKKKEIHKGQLEALNDKGLILCEVIGGKDVYTYYSMHVIKRFSIKSK